MNAGLSLVRGKVSNLRFSVEERQSKAAEFERKITLLSPILLALSGNGGLAIGHLVIQKSAELMGRG
ncbi:hypothetical protein R75465_02373 [Paraburkholderia aspalathi]|nr:hypothetical protein R75465_02373 [Paraburkholderia aspalathi]